MNEHDKDIDTQLLHLGRDPSKYAGMVNTPVFRTSTVIFPNLAAYEDRRDQGFKTVKYGRHGTPTTFAFEEAVAKIEGGYQAVAVPNGMAAIAGADGDQPSGWHVLFSQGDARGRNMPQAVTKRGV